MHVGPVFRQVVGIELPVARGSPSLAAQRKRLNGAPYYTPAASEPQNRSPYRRHGIFKSDHHCPVSTRLKQAQWLPRPQKARRPWVEKSLESWTPFTLCHSRSVAAGCFIVQSFSADKSPIQKLLDTVTIVAPECLQLWVVSNGCLLETLALTISDEAQQWPPALIILARFCELERLP